MPFQQSFPNQKASARYGGELRKKKKNRGYRPLSVKSSMHLVLRSTQAKGAWSFRAKGNPEKIAKFVQKISSKYGVKILGFANVGNHLHFHIKIHSRELYKAWIKGLTGGIAIMVTHVNKLTRLKTKFWDARPFSVLIRHFKAYKNLLDYIKINQLEGLGFSRSYAEVWVRGSG